MILTIVSMVSFLKTLHGVLYTLYLLQLKEYRLDRLSEHLLRREGGFLKSLLHFSVYAPFSISQLPKPTTKSIIIALFSLFSAILYFLYTTPLLHVVGIFLAPLLIFIGVIFFFPFEWLVRKYTYDRTSRMVTSLKREGLIVIGVTGSYGKTSTKNFIAHLLSTTYPVLTTPESVNTPLGISRVILAKLTSAHIFLVVEMGAYKRGEISEICRIVHPDCAVITGIGNQHIALFGDQESIIRAKSELIESLPKGAPAYINNTSHYQPIYNVKMVKSIQYGDKSQIYPYVKYVPEKLPPIYQINLQPAVLIAQRYKVSSNAIKRALSTLPTPQHALELHTGYKEARIIDDSYSANENGARVAISYMGNFRSKKKIIVFRPLIELGVGGADIHASLIKSMSTNCDKIFVTEAEYYTPPYPNVEVIENAKQLVTRLSKLLDKNTIVLIEGRVPATVVSFLLNKKCT